MPASERPRAQGEDRASRPPCAARQASAIELRLHGLLRNADVAAQPRAAGIDPRRVSRARGGYARGNEGAGFDPT